MKSIIQLYEFYWKYDSVIFFKYIVINVGFSNRLKGKGFVNNSKYGLSDKNIYIFAKA